MAQHQTAADPAPGDTPPVDGTGRDATLPTDGAVADQPTGAPAPASPPTPDGGQTRGGPGLGTAGPTPLRPVHGYVLRAMTARRRADSRGRLGVHRGHLRVDAV